MVFVDVVDFVVEISVEFDGDERSGYLGGYIGE